MKEVHIPEPPQPLTSSHRAQQKRHACMRELRIVLSDLIWNRALELLSVIMPIVMDVRFGIDLESCFGIAERDCAYRDGCVFWN